MVKVSDSEKIVRDLASQKILVRDRSIFSGFENTLRITIGDWHLMEKVIKTILKYPWMNTDKITLIGLGKLGLPLLTTFASSGQKILGIDIDQEKNK